MMEKHKPVKREKLSKKLFMELEEGLFLVSNITDDEDAKPIFAEGVWPLSIRELQWQSIVACQANNRLCEIFQSKADFEEYYFYLLLECRCHGNPKKKRDI